MAPTGQSTGLGYYFNPMNLVRHTVTVAAETAAGTAEEKTGYSLDELAHFGQVLREQGKEALFGFGPLMPALLHLKKLLNETPQNEEQIREVARNSSEYANGDLKKLLDDLSLQELNEVLIERYLTFLTENKGLFEVSLNFIEGLTQKAPAFLTLARKRLVGYKTHLNVENLRADLELLRDDVNRHYEEYDEDSPTGQYVRHLTHLIQYDIGDDINERLDETIKDIDWDVRERQGALINLLAKLKTEIGIKLSDVVEEELKEPPSQYFTISISIRALLCPAPTKAMLGETLCVIEGFNDEPLVRLCEALRGGDLEQILPLARTADAYVSRKISEDSGRLFRVLNELKDFYFHPERGAPREISQFLDGQIRSIMGLIASPDERVYRLIDALKLFKADRTKNDGAIQAVEAFRSDREEALRSSSGQSISAEDKHLADQNSAALLYFLKNPGAFERTDLLDQTIALFERIEEVQKGRFIAEGVRAARYGRRVLVNMAQETISDVLGTDVPSLFSFAKKGAESLSLFSGLSDLGAKHATGAVTFVLKKAKDHLTSNPDLNPVAVGQAAQAFDEVISQLSGATSLGSFVAALTNLPQTLSRNMPPSLVNGVELFFQGVDNGEFERNEQIRSEMFRTLSEPEETITDPEHWVKQKEALIDEVGTLFNGSMNLNALEKICGFFGDSDITFEGVNSFGALMSRVENLDEFKNELYLLIDQRTDIWIVFRWLIKYLIFPFTWWFIGLTANNGAQMIDKYLEDFIANYKFDSDNKKFLDPFRALNQFTLRYYSLVREYSDDKNKGKSIDDYILDRLNEGHSVRDGESQATIYEKVASEMVGYLPNVNLRSSVAGAMSAVSEFASSDTIKNGYGAINNMLIALKWLFLALPAHLFLSTVWIVTWIADMILSFVLSFTAKRLITGTNAVEKSVGRLEEALFSSQSNEIINDILFEVLDEAVIAINEIDEDKMTLEAIPEGVQIPIRTMVRNFLEAAKLYEVSGCPPDLEKLLDGPHSFIHGLNESLEAQYIPKFADNLTILLRIAAEKLLEPTTMRRLSCRVLGNIKESLAAEGVPLSGEEKKRRDVKAKATESEIRKRLDYVLFRSVKGTIEEDYAHLGLSQEANSSFYVGKLRKTYLGPDGVIETTKAYLDGARNTQQLIDYLSEVVSEMGYEDYRPDGVRNLGSHARSEIARLENRLLLPLQKITTTITEVRTLQEKIGLKTRALQALRQIQEELGTIKQLTRGNTLKTEEGLTQFREVRRRLSLLTEDLNRLRGIPKVTVPLQEIRNINVLLRQDPDNDRASRLILDLSTLVDSYRDDLAPTIDESLHAKKLELEEKLRMIQGAKCRLERVARGHVCLHSVSDNQVMILNQRLAALEEKLTEIREIADGAGGRETLRAKKFSKELSPLSSSLLELSNRLEQLGGLKTVREHHLMGYARDLGQKLQSVSGLLEAIEGGDNAARLTLELKRSIALHKPLNDEITQTRERLFSVKRELYRLKEDEPCDSHAEIAHLLGRIADGMERSGERLDRGETQFLELLRTLQASLLRGDVNKEAISKFLLMYDSHLGIIEVPYLNFEPFNITKLLSGVINYVFSDAKHRSNVIKEMITINPGVFKLLIGEILIEFLRMKNSQK